MALETYPSRNRAVDDEVVAQILQRMKTQAPPPLSPSRFLGQADAPSTVAPAILPPQPTQPLNIAGPVRVPTDDNAPPPVPGYIQELERVAASYSTPTMTPDYSNASSRPEMGTEYMDRTGQVRPADQQAAMKETGLTFPTRAAELPPPTRIPTLAGGQAIDSTVLPPIGGDLKLDGPKRFDPDAVNVKREPGESDAAYNARVSQEYLSQLRTASKDSKVERTATGAQVGPPMKVKGLKGRAGTGGRMALRTIGAGTKYGVGGGVGAGLVGLLTGLFAPGYERSLEREDQVAAAEAQAKGDDATLSRERQATMDDARMQEIKDLPKRRQDASDEQQRDNLRQMWQILANSPTGFDPKNPEHKAIQDAAGKLGLTLTSVPAKASTVPKRGLENAITVSDAQGNKYYVDKTTQEPILDPKDPTGRTPLYASRVLPTNDVAGENANLKNEAERQQAAELRDQAQRQAEGYQKKATAAELEVARLEKEVAGWGEVLEANLTPAQKTTQAQLGRKRTEAAQAAEKATEWWNKRAEHDIKAKTTPTLKTKASKGGSYAGQSFPQTTIDKWATAHSMTPEAARRLFEAEGATIR